MVSIGTDCCVEVAPPMKLVQLKLTENKQEKKADDESS